MDTKRLSAVVVGVAVLAMCSAQTAVAGSAPIVAASNAAVAMRNPTATAIMQTETPGTPAVAASAPGAVKKWHFTIPIGMWPFGIEGPVGISGYSKDVDVSMSDVQEVKDRALGFALEAGYEKITGLMQIAYLRFEPDPSTTTLPDETVVTGNPRLEWYTAELAGAYRALLVNPGPTMLVVEPLAGVRYTKLKGSVDVDDPPDLEFEERDVDWVDPFVGFRALKSFTTHIGLSVRGDVGAGGSNLTWNAGGSVGYRFPFESSALTVALGYKATGIDYESDEANEFFMDQTMSGPTIGVAYSF